MSIEELLLPLPSGRASAGRTEVVVRERAALAALGTLIDGLAALGAGARSRTGGAAGAIGSSARPARPAPRPNAGAATETGRR
ncbi:hypothetical protein [Kitasatospora sp. NPDC059571]|uniref:hypothetical protein n=1 Tax=Kitasatospora sp. NPDC059571 TaxID=3346871 RepID=UPI00368C348C